MTLVPLKPIKLPYGNEKRPELDVGWLKLQLWQMTQFKRIVMIDSDARAIQSLEGLFLQGVKDPPTLVA